MKFEYEKRYVGWLVGLKTKKYYIRFMLRKIRWIKIIPFYFEQWPTAIWTSLYIGPFMFGIRKR